MSHRIVSNPIARVALLLAVGMALPSPPARGQEAPETYRWSLEVAGTGTLVIDLPPGWKPALSERSDGLANWLAITRNRCELDVHVVGSPEPDPAFNGPTALHDFVRRQAETLLPDAIESRYTLTELRGPDGGGYYFALRWRVPRRKQDAYTTQGAIGLGNLRAEFVISSPTPALPEIQSALKALAAARIDRHEAQEETP